MYISDAYPETASDSLSDQQVLSEFWVGNIICDDLSTSTGQQVMFLMVRINQYEILGPST